MMISDTPLIIGIIVSAITLTKLVNAGIQFQNML